MYYERYFKCSSFCTHSSCFPHGKRVLNCDLNCPLFPNISRSESIYLKMQISVTGAFSSIMNVLHYYSLITSSPCVVQIKFLSTLFLSLPSPQIDWFIGKFYIFLIDNITNILWLKRWSFFGKLIKQSTFILWDRKNFF